MVYFDLFRDIESIDGKNISDDKILVTFYGRNNLKVHEARECRGKGGATKFLEGK